MLSPSTREADELMRTPVFGDKDKPKRKWLLAGKKLPECRKSKAGMAEPGRAKLCAGSAKAEWKHSNVSDEGSILMKLLMDVAKPGCAAAGTGAENSGQATPRGNREEDTRACCRGEAVEPRWAGSGNSGKRLTCAMLRMKVGEPTIAKFEAGTENAGRAELRVEAADPECMLSGAGMAGPKHKVPGVDVAGLGRAGVLEGSTRPSMATRKVDAAKSTRAKLWGEVERPRLTLATTGGELPGFSESKVGSELSRSLVSTALAELPVRQLLIAGGLGPRQPKDLKGKGEPASAKAGASIGNPGRQGDLVGRVGPSLQAPMTGSVPLTSHRIVPLAGKENPKVARDRADKESPRMAGSRAGRGKPGWPELRRNAEEASKPKSATKVRKPSRHLSRTGRLAFGRAQLRRDGEAAERAHSETNAAGPVRAKLRAEAAKPKVAESTAEVEGSGRAKPHAKAEGLKRAKLWRNAAGPN